MRKELTDAVMNKLAACKCRKKAGCKNAQQIKPVQLNGSTGYPKTAALGVADVKTQRRANEVGYGPAYSGNTKTASLVDRIMLRMAYDGTMSRNNR